MGYIPALRKVSDLGKIITAGGLNMLQRAISFR